MEGGGVCGSRNGDVGWGGRLVNSTVCMLREVGGRRVKDEELA